MSDGAASLRGARRGRLRKRRVGLAHLAVTEGQPRGANAENLRDAFRELDVDRATSLRPVRDGRAAHVEGLRKMLLRYAALSQREHKALCGRHGSQTVNACAVIRNLPVNLPDERYKS